jgi:hypothetical protein
MKNYALILLVILSFLDISAAAATKAHFFGIQAMVQIVSAEASGNADQDGVEVYRSMNVPIQDTVIGPGKAIITPDKVLRFTCGIRNSSIYECSILIQRSAASRLDPIGKKIEYRLQGTEAEFVRNLFYLNQGEYHFKSTDGLMKMDVSPGSFVFIYSAQGT